MARDRPAGGNASRPVQTIRKEKLVMAQYGFKENLRNDMCVEDLARQQLRRFGWSMISLAVCISLYYLGFFGTTEGPMNPARLGMKMAEFGVNRTHVILVLAAIFLVSIAWNWIYNLIGRVRFRSGDTTREAGANASTKTYQPIKKGVWGHTLWMAVLIVLAGVIIRLQ